MHAVSSTSGSSTVTGSGSGKGSGKSKKTAPAAPVANASGVIRVVRNPAVVPGATVDPAAAARVLTQVTALPKAAAPAQPSLNAPTADKTDDAAPQTTPADFGKTILRSFGIAPEAPTLQTRTQYIALASRLMADTAQSAPATAHDAPHASSAGTPKPHAASTRRVDVTA
jgi:hypothetical protein